ncbi:MAG: ferritin-like domain-containing protein [Candidatus Tyrphobacter sp.]
MGLGSAQHKELFCRSFIQTHVRYEPESLAWPELGEEDLRLLRSLPVWDTLWQVERNAGVMVTAFARNQRDALVREAFEVQGYEEERHGRLIAEMVRRYDLPATSSEPTIVPTRQEFVDFGCGECIDSFIGFGVFKLARQAGLLPEPLFAILGRVLAEESRHITFFVNWLAYERARASFPSRLAHSLQAARGYATGVRKVLANVRAAAGAARNGDDVFSGLTPERVLRACLSENKRLMSAFDARINAPEVHAASRSRGVIDDSVRERLTDGPRAV